MSALTQPRMTTETREKTFALPLAIGAKCFQGGMAAADVTLGTITPAVAGNANLINIGEFAESVDNTAGAAVVQTLVNLNKEIVLRWYDNAAGGGAVLAANLFANVYMLDDHTVTITSTGNSVAGRVWVLDPIKGVAVQSLST